MDKYKYCFLDTKYEGSNHLYLVVLADEYFWDIAYLITDLDGLKNMKNQYITDYSFDSEYLQCYNGLPSVPENEVVIRNKNTLLKITHNQSLFTLLCEGTKNKFLILADAAVESGLFSDGCCEFRKIQYSKSTMSCYCKMVTKSGIFNKMIVTVDKSPVLSPFYFATPRDYQFNNSSCKFIKDTEINGIAYNIWNTGILPLFEDDICLSKPLINKAVNMVERYSAAKVLIYNLVKKLAPYPNDTGKEWIGGSGSYSPRCYVRLKSTTKKFNADAKIEITDYVMKNINAMSLQQLHESLIKSQKFSNLQKFSGAYLASVLDAIKHSENMDIGIAINTLHSIEYSLMLTSMFTYRVCLHLLITKKHLVSYDEGYMIGGGGERDFTFVEEVF